jgi:diguanylate cyclase (GGDEF)-like protein
VTFEPPADNGTPPPGAAAWRRLLWQPVLGLGIACLLLVGLFTPQWVQRLDLMLFDQVAPQRPAAPADAIVLAVDGPSLGTLGRWPWPRSIHAALIDALGTAGAASITIPLIFAEPDPDPANDQALAAAIARHGRVILPLTPVQSGTSMTAGYPLQALRQAAAGIGHVDMEIDVDGQVRGLFLRAGVGRELAPALGLASYQAMQPANTASPLPGRRAPTGGSPDSWRRDAQVLLPRMAQPAPRISVLDALRHPESLAAVRGRAVFIGITEPGLGGELSSPVLGRQITLPAVDLHAHVHESLRAGALITPAAATAQAVYALLLVGLLVLWPLRGHAAPGGSTRALAWIAGISLLLPLLVSALLLHTRQLWLAPMAATLALAAGLALGLGLQAESLALLCASLDECQRSGNDVRIASTLLRPQPDGEPHQLRVGISALRNAEQQPDGAVIVVSDVTDAVASAHRLQIAATHDTLTGLPNRVLFQERLALALARVQRHDSRLAVLFIDLNRFKRINDSLGHRLGDQVLREVASRLAGICRSTDLVARWGGDEFVVLMEDVSSADAVALAAAKLVGALGEDIAVDDLQLSSSCSVGIAMAPQDGTDCDQLLARADSAMYRAKGLPGAGFHFYSSELKVWTREYLALEGDLRRALQEQQFVLHYQPQFDLRSGALVGHEALLRWQRSPQELVQPADFIGVAEETGLIVEIGAWVVQQAARDIAASLAARRPVVPVAINVSARQCLNRHIVEVLRRALRETRVPAALLTLEITETTAMTDVAGVQALLEEISALGVRIALDDFGTGYSSLSYLRRFPIHELKIDRSFVQNITTHPDDAAIVRATIALAHGLGIPVVAEGVESEAQREFLVAQRCDRVQGFLYGRPQALEDGVPLAGAAASDQ